MILTNENGVTIQALIITIVLLLILVSIGTTAGTSALEYSKYSKLKTEMQLLQTKVNELNEKKEYSNGQELTDAQKAILNKKEISDIISQIPSINKNQRRKKLSCRPMLEFVSLLYVYNLIVSDKVKLHRIKELKGLFFDRMLDKKEFFKNNQLIKSNYDFICKVINFFF